MYSYITVADRVAAIRVNSGYGPGPHVRLIGSTFPIVPAGTVMDNFSVTMPDGLHAMAFMCRFEGERERGSGRNRRLEHIIHSSCAVLLAWVEGGKSFVMDAADMKAEQLAMFNSFVRSDENIFVTDTERKIAFVSGTLPRQLDPEWTYKCVPALYILDYIAKKITLDELDARAISEVAARDELVELRQKFMQSAEDLERASILNLSAESRARQCERERANLEEAHDAMREAFTRVRSHPVHNLLSKAPVSLQPKATREFVASLQAH